MESDRIFVALTICDSQDGGQILHSLFSMAARPDRVFVGVLEHKRSSAPTAVSRYHDHHQAAQQFLRQPSPGYLHSIQYMDRSLDTATGASVARLELARFYKDEKFVLFLHEGKRTRW